MESNKIICFDFWGTLMTSNPSFKAAQYSLAKEYLSDLTKEDWLERKSRNKKIADTLAETKGLHVSRNESYSDILGIDIRRMNEFIHYSNELFLKHPPIINSPFNSLLSMELLRSKGYRLHVSSNTVLIHGDILSQVIFDNFGIVKSNCLFSDEVGFSKPNPLMWKFPKKPDFHVGDNILTDGKSVEQGIPFVHVDKLFEFLINNKLI